MQARYEASDEAELLGLVVGFMFVVASIGYTGYLKYQKSAALVKKAAQAKTATLATIEKEKEKLLKIEAEKERRKFQCAQKKAALVDGASGEDNQDEGVEDADAGYKRQLNQYNRKLRTKLRSLLRDHGVDGAPTFEKDKVAELEALETTEVERTVLQLCEKLGVEAPQRPTRADGELEGGDDQPADSGLDARELLRRLDLRIAQLREERRDKEAALGAQLAEWRKRDRVAKETKNRQSEREWSPEELAALARGVVKYRTGTNRWDLIAQMINAVNGTKGEERSAKDAIKMSKKVEMNLGSAAAVKVVQVGAAATAESTMAPTAVAAASAPQKEVWNAEQQACFEKAIRDTKTLPSSERWVAVAAAVPGKTRKDVVRRFKEIQEVIKQRRAP